MWVSSDEIEEVTAAKLEERYKLAKTIKGTQSFHKFIPIPGTRQVRCKHVSSAETEVIKTCSLQLTSAKTPPSLWAQLSATCHCQGPWP